MAFVWVPEIGSFLKKMPGSTMWLSHLLITFWGLEPKLVQIVLSRKLQETFLNWPNESSLSSDVIDIRQFLVGKLPQPPARMTIRQNVAHPLKCTPAVLIGMTAWFGISLAVLFDVIVVFVWFFLCRRASWPARDSLVFAWCQQLPARRWCRSKALSRWRTGREGVRRTCW